MAVSWSELEKLNETLTGLRFTSKGRLRYNGDINFSEEQLTCSLESILNESSESFNVLDVRNFHFVDNDSSFEKYETKSTAELNKSARRTDCPPGLPINFDSENERIIKKHKDVVRGNTEQRKEERGRILERRMENLKQDSEQELRSNQECLAEEKRLFECEITEQKQQAAEELKRHQVRLDEEVKAHKRRIDDILTKSLLEESHLAREAEERKEALKNLKNNIELLYHQVLINIKVIQEKFNNSTLMSFVSAQDYEDISTVLAGITTKGKAIVAKSWGTREPSCAEDCLEDINKLVKDTLSIDNKVMDILKQAQEKAAVKKKEIEEAEKIRLQEKRKEQQRVVMDRKVALEKALEAKREEKSPITVSQDKQDNSQLKMKQFISDNALAEYVKLQEHLSTVQASFKEFTSDQKQTKYKFDLQKAVNIPINALSAHSPSQLNDKIIRLVTLLSGENVEIGGKQVNCGGHPSAMLFCKDLVAKKLVAQGAQQVSSNPSSAFLYAAVIVGLWSAFPDVGELILAHFHKSYPYLVPYYMPQVEGQSTNDYHKALGYAVNNDKIEDENHFLNKLSGTVQLYAAVISSKGATMPDHPYGVDKGWTWLARTLNLKPYPSITATMLFEFIKVAGHLLREQYGKQFQKMLLMLCKDFIPAIEKVTPAEKRGPTQRFKDFLEECIKSQRIAVPKGYLTERWWQTGHF